MKNLFRISLLLTILCFAAPVFADGDMTTGNKTCTSNCSGLFNGTNQTPITPGDVSQDGTLIESFYNWLNKQISGILN